MSIYFINETPDIKWRAVKKSIPVKNGVFCIPPLSRLNKKRLEIIKNNLARENALYFSQSDASETLFCCSEETVRAFFYSTLALSLKKFSRILGFSSVTLFDADEDTALLFLSSFPSIYLSGENAGKISDILLLDRGAAVPVAEHEIENSAAVFLKNAALFSGIAFHHSFLPGALKKYGAKSLLYRPKGSYAFITERIGRLLNCKEAARLSAADKSAAFDISFK